MNTGHGKLKSPLSYFPTHILFGIIFVAITLLAAGKASATSQSAQCPIPPNPGQCICHNVTMGGGGEICPSSSGIVNGHDAHILCFNKHGFGCSVQDSCGKCNGCGNGIVETGEQCDDGNNVAGDGCSVDCKLECSSNAECADSNPCTDDVCSPTTHFCVHTNNNASCDDGLFCTENDTCNAGECHGSQKACDDGIECTGNVCNEADNQCENPPINCECAVDQDCNDNNVCTDEYCGPDLKCHRSNNTNSCDDELFCNGADHCSEGTCSVHDGDPCSQGGECADSCNEELDTCNEAAGTPCTDDGNVCTDNECNGNGECVASNNTAPCDDGQFCTEYDVCSGGACNGIPRSCDDGIECTEDVCNEVEDQCENPTSSCECVVDEDCDDGNVCTDEYCGDDFQCYRSDNEDPCDDGLFCNGADQCGEGTCSVHNGDPCTQGAECADSCDEAADSCNNPAGTSCTDDGNTCTDNECNGNGECVANNNTAACNDGNPCTEGDVCADGSCQAGGPKDCSDGLTCSADSCEPNSGECLHDMSACFCADDQDCEDQNPCTSDSCNVVEGVCVNSPQTGASCDDGNLCTGQDGQDQCNAEGICTGPAVDCDDGNVCTADSCDPSVGCEHAPIPGCCESDQDGDGVCDDVDNCVDVANSNQADSDNNGVGDACQGEDSGQGGSGGSGVSPCLQGSGTGSETNNPDCGGFACSLRVGTSTDAFALGGPAALLAALVMGAMLGLRTWARKKALGGR